MKLNCPRSVSLKKCCAHQSLLKCVLLLSSALALSMLLAARIQRPAERREPPRALAEQPGTSHAAEKFPSVKEFERSAGEKFDNEQARPIGFPSKVAVAKAAGSPKVIYLATKYFGEWNPRHYYFPQLGNATFGRYPCATRSCWVTNRPSDLGGSHAVLFHVRDLEVFSVPPARPPRQLWVLYSMEPPWLEVRDLRRFEGLFNWTMSYRRGSDLRVAYGFVGRREKPAPVDRRRLEALFREKGDRALWYVSNCRTDSNREEYVMRLRKVYPVDVVGGCGTEGCRPAESERCYARMARAYKFYLAFENAICRDYATEKLFNALAYTVIPVTLGGANYSRIVPPNSIIDAMQFPSPEELGKFLWQVSASPSLYMSYFEWKGKYRSYLQPWMCDLCEKLHETVTHKTVPDLETWWNEGGSCRRWSAEGFVTVQNHAFPEYHTHKFQ